MKVEEIDKLLRDFSRMVTAWAAHPESAARINSALQAYRKLAVESQNQSAVLRDKIDEVHARADRSYAVVFTQGGVSDGGKKIYSTRGGATAQANLEIEAHARMGQQAASLVAQGVHPGSPRFPPYLLRAHEPLEVQIVEYARIEVARYTMDEWAAQRAYRRKRRK